MTTQASERDDNLGQGIKVFLIATGVLAIIGFIITAGPSGTAPGCSASAYAAYEQERDEAYKRFYNTSMLARGRAVMSRAEYDQLNADVVMVHEPCEAAYNEKHNIRVKAAAPRA